MTTLSQKTNVCLTFEIMSLWDFSTEIYFRTWSLFKTNDSVLFWVLIRINEKIDYVIYHVQLITLFNTGLILHIKKD